MLTLDKELCPPIVVTSGREDVVLNNSIYTAGSDFLNILAILPALSETATQVDFYTSRYF